MRSLPVFVVLLALAACGFGQGWVGQGRVNRPYGGDTCAMMACIAVDAGGRPWVVWHVTRGETTLYYTRWSGDRWDDERGVGPDTVTLWRLRPALCFDGQDRAWVTWTNLYPNTSYDVFSSCWTGTGWSDAVQVNQPDSDACDEVSQIAYGGGQLWCVWSGGPSSSNLSVFASRWDDVADAWEPEMRVSPPDGNLHWFTDLAVDSTGTPHVVWCTDPLYTVFYSFYDGDSWSRPLPVNDTTSVIASSRADPHIAIDNTGILHLCFTGWVVGAMYRDIFYTGNDGSGWQPCQLVTRDRVYHEWYSDIAADRPDNIWVVWDRQGEGPDQFRVYASRYDGIEWSQEERLDNDSAYYDMCAGVCLDTAGYPWVVWDGKPYSAGIEDIFYNRYEGPGAVEEPMSAGLSRARFRLTARMAAARAVGFHYETSAPGSVRLDVFDKLGRRVWSAEEKQLPAGQHVTLWNGRCVDGTPASAGIYFCRLSATGIEETCSFMLLSKDKRRL